MRLKIDLYKENFNIPIGYNHILQATIYNMLRTSGKNSFYHDTGYRKDEKVFKLFVFSNLFGSFTIQNKQMVFKDSFCFYISAMDEDFLQGIYQFLLLNPYLFINNQRVEVRNVHILETPFVKKSGQTWIKTLSPITVYSKKEDFITYYNPEDEEFKQLIYQNVLNKIEAYQLIVNDSTFEILEVKDIKRRMVKYKNCIYKAFQLKMKVNISQDMLNVLYNTGMSAKGSCGFGMIDMYYEKNNISL